MIDQPNNINVFWFKRDLRLYDNDALKAVLSKKLPILLIYIYEPSLFANSHYSERHWRFIYQSIADLNIELKKYNAEVVSVFSEVIPFFEKLIKDFKINAIYSTEETGIQLTYQRDIQFDSFTKKSNIEWKQFRNGGVIRGLKNRDTWRKEWYGYMSASIFKPEIEQSEIISIDIPEALKLPSLHIETYSKNSNFQNGGRTEGLKWADSFFNERLQFYSEYISKPELSRLGCSRLSPYFAWGCISVREIYQRSVLKRKEGKYKKQLSAFMSRLRWQAHFIQKFEMEPRIEFEAFNKGYMTLAQPINENFVEAWKNGQTGFPLVDAAMRAVAATGYLNFRMRTMSVSFLVHLMFQHFTTGSEWLARQFLDFEPGIHYAQFQMQAGFTATNTIRIYNPTKNAKDHDPEAVFIKKWVPELSHLPTKLAIEPWSITPMEEVLYNFKIGDNYPPRILDISQCRKQALNKLYGKRKEELTKTEKQRILDVHTLKRRFA